MSATSTTAVYYLPVSKQWKRKRQMFKQQATVTALSHSGSEWLLNRSGIILETTEVMHFSKDAIIFTVEISSDIALLCKGVLVPDVTVSQDWS